jgi:predicted PurR-regulated permease PerM
MATETRAAQQSATGTEAKPTPIRTLEAGVEAFVAPTGLAAALSSLPLALGLVSTTIIIAGLYYGRGILVPLALAFFLGFVLDPWVTRLKRLGIPRPLAVMVVVSLTLAAIGGAGFLLAQQVRTLSAQLPIYQSNIQEKLQSFRLKLSAPGMFDGAVTTFDAVKKEVDRATQDTPASSARPQQVEIQQPPDSPLEKATRWLAAIGGPLTDAGIVLIFVVVFLLDRQDLRDRLLRLLGGNLHRTTDAMDEAGERIGKYLTMQLVVNASYGVPMAAGLWVIGVPGAILWGALAAIMRFVPYIGPMISALFPLALAFAVDPGWTMLFWTLALIVFLELISNNVVEPWLYGASTGLSAMSLIVSATFWTLVWGPVGLVISTPLTVCLLVIGRHLPQLRFFAVLLGSQPVLDPATRVYQRLLAGDVEEAIELSLELVQADGVTGFYEKVGIPALRIACVDHDRVATAEHRLRVVSGVDRLIDELGQSSTAPSAARPQVLCLGAKWEVDTLAARMVVHGLSESGVTANVQAIDTAAVDFAAKLDVRGLRMICLSHFSPDPETRIRYLCRHLRKRWPKLHIVAALWNAPPDLLDAGAAQALGVDAVAASFDEVMLHARHHLGQQLSDEYLAAPIPAGDRERVRALRASGAFDEALRHDFDRAAKRAAEVFDAPIGLVTLIDESMQEIGGASVADTVSAASPGSSGERFKMARELSLCGHVVASSEPLIVADVARDPRFANNAALAAEGIRFYAGVPFRDAEGHVLGSLCILDRNARSFSESDVRLLQSMADELRAFLRPAVPDEPGLREIVEREQEPASATVAQPVP